MTDLFTEKATNWDADDMVLQLSSAIGSAILDSVALNDNMEVMDFGAGTGLISSHIAPLVMQITAVDVSRSMLEKLAAKPELQNKVTSMCQDIIYEPLNKQFDLIVSAMAMHHVESTEALIDSFTRHLKVGGRIALADLDKEDGSFHPENTEGVFHDGFDREQFATLLRQHGFTGIDFQTAITVNKNGRPYPVFLVTAQKN